jgi:hypothetical protein
MKLVLLLGIVVLVALATRATILLVAGEPNARSRSSAAEVSPAPGPTSAVADSSADPADHSTAVPGVERRVIERPLSRFQQALVDDVDRGMFTRSAVQAVVDTAIWEAAVECAEHADELGADPDELGARLLELTAQVHATGQRLVINAIEYVAVVQGAPMPEALRTCIATSLGRPRAHDAEPHESFLDLEFELPVQAILVEVSAE